ncbi:MAG: GNAT family N-acetyltransferase [Flavitalea sp.]
MNSNIIRYVHRKDIDSRKWDHCIEHANNGLVYGYSWYLDEMAKEWDALISGDYEYVFPLPFRKKYGIYYVYQPAFTAQMGVFGKNVSKDIVAEFIKAIPTRFRLLEVNLNAGNDLSFDPSQLVNRFNFVLDCNKEFDRLRSGFRENILRNIKKAKQYQLSYHTNVQLQEVFELSKQTMLSKTNLSDKDYEHFDRLVKKMFLDGTVEIVGVRDQHHQLLASAVFLFSHGRAYYVMVGNHPNGKTLGASHFLIASFIESHAGQNLLLDFEGSDIPSLAFFYSSFGAVKEIYSALRIYRLPWWAKIFKK